MHSLISIDNLSKIYSNNFKALNSINLEIKKGASSPWSFGIIKELENNLTVFNQFLKYKKLGDKLNIKIVNLSEDSWLDFFDKKSYEKLIENKN